MKKIFLLSLCLSVSLYAIEPSKTDIKLIEPTHKKEQIEQIEKAYNHIIENFIIKYNYNFNNLDIKEQSEINHKKLIQIRKIADTLELYFKKKKEIEEQEKQMQLTKIREEIALDRQIQGVGSREERIEIIEKILLLQEKISIAKTEMRIQKILLLEYTTDPKKLKELL